MKAARLLPNLSPVPIVLVVISVLAGPASALTPCEEAARAYATRRVSLVTPLTELKKCVEDELEKKNKKDAKAEDANDPACRATAARYSNPGSELSAEDLATLRVCMTEAIKAFEKEE